MPPEWSPDPTSTVQEIVVAVNENRLWHKRLRADMADLVNDKLAERIGREEYAASRLSANTELAECKRRGKLLLSEIDARNHRMKIS